MTDDFFRSRLDQMIDNSHPVAVLASRLPWEKMQARVAPQFVHQVPPLKQREKAPDLAGPVVKVSGGKASNTGRPRLGTRLMIALTLLKNSFDRQRRRTGAALCRERLLAILCRLRILRSPAPV